MIKYTEVFFSIQGEGRFIGVPSVFVRLFGCNLKCPDFGRGPGSVTQEKYIKDIKGVRKLEDVPIPEIGCDSSFSWHPKFKKLAKEKTPTKLVEKIIKILPLGSWATQSGNDNHLVFTGGEPLLWQKPISEMMVDKKFVTLKNITFETNGTQKLFPEFIACLNKTEKHITFSVSPKLSNSGEKFSDCIKSSVIRSMNKINNSFLYLKFVVRSEQNFEEIEKALKYYREKGAHFDAVYVMPEGATEEQLRDDASIFIAQKCLKEGYYFSPRLHVLLFGNNHGT